MLVFHLIQAILLKKAVSPLLQISTRATAICSEDGISLKISPPSVSGMVMVLLQINSSNFHRFRCNSNCIESLDLSFLNSLLSTTNDLESLIVSANYSHDTTLIYFNFFTNTHHNAQFESDQTRLLLYYEPRTPGNPYNYLGIHESEYEYQVILGIPSKEFRQILRYIREFATLIVDVIVTNAEVLTFRSGSEDLILTKEAGCIVWGVDSSNQVSFRMTLFNINSFIEASENSAFVWMFQSPDFPGMLNCPVGHLGNIKYYFDKRYDLRIH
ncbi:Proliferating cell nuclear antigen [Camellia lanceoleosa]|uniref:Proliferating cell nuclear antigen n=1 Tax=Camellia lanceoleosa TaxID=1840588 RepID=A0ACC0IGG1_9ERIC|nr:Proliferating cell nuclear antigen [Camellia lanceoleosa]